MKVKLILLSSKSTDSVQLAFKPSEITRAILVDLTHFNQSKMKKEKKKKEEESVITPSTLEISSFLLFLFLLFSIGHTSSHPKNRLDRA